MLMDMTGDTRRTYQAQRAKSIVITKTRSSVALEEKTIILRPPISTNLILSLLLLLKTGNAFFNSRSQHEALIAHPRVGSSFEQRYPTVLKDEKSANGYWKSPMADTSLDTKRSCRTV